MLIIDEADLLKPNDFAEVRQICDRLAISVILFGTDRLDFKIRRDEQIYNRFRDRYRVEKLAGDNFRQTVEIWERRILCLPSPSTTRSLELHQNRLFLVFLYVHPTIAAMIAIMFRLDPVTFPLIT